MYSVRNVSEMQSVPTNFHEKTILTFPMSNFLFEKVLQCYIYQWHMLGRWTWLTWNCLRKIPGGQKIPKMTADIICSYNV